MIYDEETRAISMATGDTLNIDVTISWAGLSDGDAVLFAIVDKRGMDVLVKPAEVTGGTAKIRLCNHDTRDLESGSYYWQIRVVTNPGKNEAGEIIADDCGDHVVTLFDKAEMPRFNLQRSGAYV